MRIINYVIVKYLPILLLYNIIEVHYIIGIYIFYILYTVDRSGFLLEPKLPLDVNFEFIYFITFRYMIYIIPV